MLGALIIFLQFALYWYCWSVNKRLSVQKASNIPITKRQFLWCSILNFIVLVPIIMIPFVSLLLIFGMEKEVGEDGMMIVSFLLSIIFVFCIIGYQYSKYRFCFSSEGLFGNFPNKSKQLYSEIQEMLVHPQSFKESYPFVEFVKANGPHIGRVSHTNNSTGKTFYTLEIRDDNGKTVSVRFHSSLGELSAEQLRERKGELYVGKRNIDHRWYLYDAAFRESGKWDSVDLGI